MLRTRVFLPHQRLRLFGRTISAWAAVTNWNAMITEAEWLATRSPRSHFPCKQSPNGFSIYQNGNYSVCPERASNLCSPDLNQHFLIPTHSAFKGLLGVPHNWTFILNFSLSLSPHHPKWLILLIASAKKFLQSWEEENVHAYKSGIFEKVLIGVRGLFGI